MTDRCEFCERLKIAKWVEEVLKEERKKAKEPRIYREWTVALVQRSWTKERGKRDASRSTYYRSRGIGYKLNFCPECGRNLKGENNENT